MSRKREQQVKEYEAGRKTDAVLQPCLSCGTEMYYRAMHRHHPAGRHGANVLKYIYLCAKCHHECHHDPKVATRRGLLWPGRNVKEISDPEWVRLLAKIKENQYST